MNRSLSSRLLVLWCCRKRSACRSGRRHLAVNYVPEPQKAADTDMLVQNHRVVLEAIEGYQYSQPQRIFTDDFLYSENPRIRRMSAKWVELGLS